ncbi:MAG: hypothetical protein JSV88_02400 [Candidatus Aminicenantes bacterium]|nr:MAG: hypothetical protein JSV88_02400 [Candidatus Aminicenantes bacterium]
MRKKRFRFFKVNLLIVFISFLWIGMEFIYGSGGGITKPKLAIIAVSHLVDGEEFIGSSMNGKYVNLIRWGFDTKYGFPPGGFDLYRCCLKDGENNWVKLNHQPIQPPKNQSEADPFINGNAYTLDGKYIPPGGIIDNDGWAVFCHLLAEVDGGATGPCADAPVTDCGTLSPSSEVSSDLEIPAMSILMLSALRPVPAILLGLYWVDRGVSPGDVCHYKIVANGWPVDEVDESESVAFFGPITTGVEINLPRPTGLSLRLIPGEGAGFCKEGEKPPPVLERTSVALKWNVSPIGSFLPTSQVCVMYNIFRRPQSASSLAQINFQTCRFSNVQRTEESPVIVTSHLRTDKYGNPILDASGNEVYDLPAIFYLDSFEDQTLQEFGKYYYAIKGIDIFGRISESSDERSIDVVDTIPPPPPENFCAGVGIVDSKIPCKTLTHDPSTGILCPGPVNYTPGMVCYNTDLRSTTIKLKWEWSTEIAGEVPDEDYFLIYRRYGTSDLEKDARGCPKNPGDSSHWQQIGNAIDITGPGSYYFTDTISLDNPEVTPNASVAYYYYRIVTVDTQNNHGPSSAPVAGFVVDMEPPPPPGPPAVFFSRSDWEKGVSLHLTWEVGSASDIMGYKIYRSLKTDAEPVPPTSQRPEEREILLNNDVIPHNPSAVSAELERLKILARLGNLYLRDPGGTPASLAETDVTPQSQYYNDILEMTATENTFFYRVMAVDQAGNPSSMSPAQELRVPDFIPPKALQLEGINGGEGEIVLYWPASAEADVELGGGYRVYRSTRPDTDFQLLNEPDLLPANYEPNASPLVPTDGSYQYSIKAPFVETGNTSGSFSAGSEPGTFEAKIDIDNFSAVNRFKGGWLKMGNQQYPVISNTAGFNVFVTIAASSNPGSGSFVIFNGIRTVEFHDQTPQGGTLYYYRVRAEDRAGNQSPDTPSYAARAYDTTPPAAPISLTAIPSSVEVILEWQHPEPLLKCMIKRTQYPSSFFWEVIGNLLIPTETTSPGDFPGGVNYVYFYDSSIGKYIYRFRDAAPPPDIELWYQVEHFDSTGNKGAFERINVHTVDDE